MEFDQAAGLGDWPEMDQTAAADGPVCPRWRCCVSQGVNSVMWDSGIGSAGLLQEFNGGRIGNHADAGGRTIRLRLLSYPYSILDALCCKIYRYETLKVFVSTNKDPPGGSHLNYEQYINDLDLELTTKNLRQSISLGTAHQTPKPRQPVHRIV